MQRCGCSYLEQCIAQTTIIRLLLNENITSHLAGNLVYRLSPLLCPCLFDMTGTEQCEGQSLVAAGAYPGYERQFTQDWHSQTVSYCPETICRPEKTVRRAAMRAVHVRSIQYKTGDLQKISSTGVTQRRGVNKPTGTSTLRNMATPLRISFRATS